MIVSLASGHARTARSKVFWRCHSIASCGCRILFTLTWALHAFDKFLLTFYRAVIAIPGIMWINKLQELQLEIVRARPRICRLRAHVTSGGQDPCLQYLLVVLLDEAVAGLKATR